MLNTITIMGRMTRDPELRRTGSGVAVASFTLAVDRDFGKNENGERETDFIDCVAWRQTGEFVSKYFTKGRMAVVKGRLEIRNWIDKEGNKRRSAEVIAENVYFGDSKRDDAPGVQEQTSAEYNANQGDPHAGYEQYPQQGGYNAPNYAPPVQPAPQMQQPQQPNNARGNAGWNGRSGGNGGYGNRSNGKFG